MPTANLSIRYHRQVRQLRSI